MEQNLRSGARFFGMESMVGAAAGSVGTVPMTLFMFAAHQWLPGWQQYALPPEKITQEAAERADVKLNKPQLLGASLTAHLGYGASMGSLYNMFARSVALPTVVKGGMFGVLVWGASYLGWLPAASFSVAAPEEPLKRNIFMIGAHIIWGVTTAVVIDQVERHLPL
jgi:hypothetical protein